MEKIILDALLDGSVRDVRGGDLSQRTSRSWTVTRASVALPA
jgi:hypothetical protein